MTLSRSPNRQKSDASDATAPTMGRAAVALDAGYQVPIWACLQHLGVLDVGASN
jgi:hypothetical protein